MAATRTSKGLTWLVLTLIVSFVSLFLLGFWGCAAVNLIALGIAAATLRWLERQLPALAAQPRPIDRLDGRKNA
jgi:hypothetical protein